MEVLEDYCEVVVVSPHPRWKDDRGCQDRRQLLCVTCDYNIRSQLFLHLVLITSNTISTPTCGNTHRRRTFPQHPRQEPYQARREPLLSAEHKPSEVNRSNVLPTHHVSVPESPAGRAVCIPGVKRNPRVSTQSRDRSSNRRKTANNGAKTTPSVSSLSL
jgi:hypothetical protein